MKKLIICIVMLTHQASFAQNSPDMEELKKLNAKFINNYVTNDTASHSQIIHPKFVYLSSRGAVITREVYLKNWAHGYDGIKYWDFRNEFINVFGNTALLHAVNKYKYLADGKEVEGMAIYTDVYVKENGKWLCIQAQITEVAPENYKNYSNIIRTYNPSTK